jgi:hypothetical protein
MQVDHLNEYDLKFSPGVNRVYGLIYVTIQLQHFSEIHVLTLVKFVLFTWASLCLHVHCIFS